MQKCLAYPGVAEAVQQVSCCDSDPVQDWPTHTSEPGLEVVQFQEHLLANVKSLLDSSSKVFLLILYLLNWIPQTDRSIKRRNMCLFLCNWKKHTWNKALPSLEWCILFYRSATWSLLLANSNSMRCFLRHGVKGRTCYWTKTKNYS